MSYITERVIIGTWLEASSKVYLDINNVSHILDCAPEVQEYFPRDYTYKTVHLVDLESFDIQPF